MKIREPKSERRKKIEFRSPKSDERNARLAQGNSVIERRYPFGFLSSNFGL